MDWPTMTTIVMAVVVEHGESKTPFGTHCSPQARKYIHGLMFETDSDIRRYLSGGPTNEHGR